MTSSSQDALNSLLQNYGPGDTEYSGLATVALVRAVQELTAEVQAGRSSDRSEVRPANATKELTLPATATLGDLPFSALYDLLTALSDAISLAGTMAVTTAVKAADGHVVAVIANPATDPASWSAQHYSDEGMAAIPGVRQAVARQLLEQVKGIEEPDGRWNGGDTVSVLTEWFAGLGLDIEGPGPRSCAECGEILQPEYWHKTAEHDGHEQPEDDEDDADGADYDLGSLAKEDARNAWQHGHP